MSRNYEISIIHASSEIEIEAIIWEAALHYNYHLGQERDYNAEAGSCKSQAMSRLLSLAAKRVKGFQR